MNNEKSIYDMKLHEQIILHKQGKIIFRVHNGWIYSDFNTRKNTQENSVFVPHRIKQCFLAR